MSVPRHVAIIPDGNRRWAKERGLPPFIGHQRGLERAQEIGKAAWELGIHTLTLWGFSTENWSRTSEEVSHLMQLFEKMISSFADNAQKYNVRIYHLGRRDRLPKTLLSRIQKSMEDTKNNTRGVLNIALDYGGHDEIVRAIQKVFHEVAEGNIAPEDVGNIVGYHHDKYPYFKFKDYLDTGAQLYPYPDLVIRTSGEQRLSGLLPWQTVYSELYFEQKYFPDFTAPLFRDIIAQFTTRTRRFGGNESADKRIDNLTEVV
jgi:undecaprenyl diphosphate synthase